MISSLNGKLIYKDNSFAVVECGGVGFRCSITKNTLSKLPSNGSDVFLHTYLSVREDALDLYGFFGSDELNSFKLITSVNGVGAKIGIAILSEFTPENLSMYIAAGDAKMLTRASGVGIKLAQRIVLELRDKVAVGTASANVAGVSGSAAPVGNTGEAVAALVSLGYSQGEAASAVSRLDGSMSVEDMIKAALKTLAGRL